MIQIPRSTRLAKKPADGHAVAQLLAGEHLDRDHLARGQIDPLVDLSRGSIGDFTFDLVAIDALGHIVRHGSPN